MSSLLMVPIPAVKLARRAWMSVFGLLLLALVGALGLGFYGHRLNQLDDAVTAYQRATQQYQIRNQALQNVNQMEEVFNLYLLRGDRDVLQFMAQPRTNLEQMAQREINGQRDPILVNLAADTKKWYEQTVQPMVDARQKVPAGQPLPEHFFDAYHAVDKTGVLFASESAQNNAANAMLSASVNPRWLWLSYPLAGLLVIGVVALVVSAVKRVHQLRQAAEDAGDEEEEDDAKEPQDDHEEHK
jgi:hypothetical protein